MSNSKNKRYKVIALISFMLIVAGLLVFLFSGENNAVLSEIFKSGATKEEIRSAISRLGFRSYLVVGILSMLQVIFTFIPAEPLHVISGVSFGLIKGGIVCLIGIMIGNTIIYLLTKIFGQKLKNYFTADSDFDFNLAKNSNKIALIVILLYVLPAIPYGIICFFAASMDMKYFKYILITGIGSIPSLVLDVGLGHITMSTSWAVSITVFVVIILLLLLMVKFKKPIFAKINAYVQKSQEKQNKKVGNYNGLVVKTLGGAIYLHIRNRVKIKLKNNVGRLEKPSIVLCNHGSFFDFVYSGKLLMKEKPHFMVARLFFQNKALSKIISSTGAFPKSMFATDVENIKNCLKVISNNEILAFMPEARLSTVGKFEDIQDSTYKFIKKMNVPVYVINISGAYLARPKWGNGIRRGAKVEAELNQLLTSEECKNIPYDEFKSKINNALYYDEWAWLESHPEIRYKNKHIAEGLENILSICPECHEKFSLQTNKNKIICEKCGNIVKMDNRYQLSGVQFKNIVEWYEWQTKVIETEIFSSPSYTLSSKVELRQFGTDGKHLTKHVGFGVCELSRDGLKYVGTKNNENFEKFFHLDNIYRLLFGAGEDFEIYDDDNIYYFVPEDKRSCVLWYIVSGLLKK